MIYKKRNLCFDCTGCGDCCRGNKDHYIAVTPADLEKIGKYLGISMAWLKRRYARRYSRTWYSICIGENGRCVFLNQDNSCRIYPVRPVQCRTYPWWPELLENITAWRHEGRRCEGIDRGQPVAVSRIIRALRKQEAFEENGECDA